MPPHTHTTHTLIRTHTRTRSWSYTHTHLYAHTHLCAHTHLYQIMVATAKKGLLSRVAGAPIALVTGAGRVAGRALSGGGGINGDMAMQMREGDAEF